MLTDKELQDFINYLLDKVQEGHLQEMEQIADDFIKSYKKHRTEYTATDLKCTFKVIRNNIEECYLDEVDNAIKELSEELVQRQIRINIRKNM